MSRSLGSRLLTTRVPIEIGDRVVDNVEPKDRDIAMVFQSYALYPAMTVRKNITFGMECRGVPKQKQSEAVARVGSLDRTNCRRRAEECFSAEAIVEQYLGLYARMRARLGTAS